MGPCGERALITGLLSLPVPQVQPTMSQFEMDTYAKSHDLMSGFWNTCYDMLMSSGQRCQRERTHSRRAFQVRGLGWGWGCRHRCWN